MAGKQLSQADRCVVGEGGENAVDDQTGEQIKEDFYTPKSYYDVYGVSERDFI